MTQGSPRQFERFQAYLLSRYQHHGLPVPYNKDGYVVMTGRVCDEATDLPFILKEKFDCLLGGRDCPQNTTQTERTHQFVAYCKELSSYGSHCVYGIGHDLLRFASSFKKDRPFLDAALEILSTDAECDPDSGYRLYEWYGTKAPENCRDLELSKKFLIMSGHNFGVPASFALGMYAKGHLDSSLPPRAGTPDLNRALYWFNRMFDQRSTGYIEETKEQIALSEMLDIYTTRGVKLSPANVKNAESVLQP